MRAGAHYICRRGVHSHALRMFVITEADAAAIRAVFDQQGELSAAIELRRRFRGSPTTRRRGRARGALPGGRRCQRSLAW